MTFGALICFGVGLYYALYLQKPLDPTTGALLGGGSVGGGVVGSAVSWVGKAAKSMMAAPDNPDAGK